MPGCEDLDSCHKFMSEVVPFVGFFSQRRFVLVDHSVSDEEFVIKVNYEKDNLQHLIQKFVRDIIKEAQRSKLYKYNWAVHRPLFDAIEEPNNFFLNSVVITITRN